MYVITSLTSGIANLTPSSPMSFQLLSVLGDTEEDTSSLNQVERVDGRREPSYAELKQFLFTTTNP